MCRLAGVYSSHQTQYMPFNRTVSSLLFVSLSVLWDTIFSFNLFSLCAKQLCISSACITFKHADDVFGCVRATPEVNLIIQRIINIINCSSCCSLTLNTCKCHDKSSSLQLPVNRSKMISTNFSFLCKTHIFHHHQ